MINDILFNDILNPIHDKTNTFLGCYLKSFHFANDLEAYMSFNNVFHTFCKLYMNTNMFIYTWPFCKRKLVNSPPWYSQNGTLWSFCTRWGPLKLYLYSNLIFGKSAYTQRIAENSSKVVSFILNSLLLSGPEVKILSQTVVRYLCREFRKMIRVINSALFAHYLTSTFFGAFKYLKQAHREQ